MGDNALVFWENVKKEIKLQNTTNEWVAGKAGISLNTFQGWISKGIFPRVDEAIRIAEALNTSVEYLFRGIAQDNSGSIDTICDQLSQMSESINLIQKTVKKIS